MSGKILIVDDEPIILNSCKKILAPVGHQIDTALSPMQAFEMMDRNHYDIIITDLRMPEMDWMVYLKQLRARHPDLPIIVMTGYPSQESLRTALSLRIVDYLTKPFSPTVLSATVQAAMQLVQSQTPQKQTPQITDIASEAIPAEVDEIIKQYRHKPGSLIPVLQKTQELMGYLPPAVQKKIARGLRVPVSEVQAVVSFYHFFTMQPKGKHCIKVCTGTACYVKGAEEILNNFKKSLHIELNGMTEDRRFSLESVRCLGACGLAPVVVIDKDTHGSVSAVNAMQLLAQYQ